MDCTGCRHEVVPSERNRELRWRKTEPHQCTPLLTPRPCRTRTHPPTRLRRAMWLFAQRKEFMNVLVRNLHFIITAKHRLIIKAVSKEQAQLPLRSSSTRMSSQRTLAFSALSMKMAMTFYLMATPSVTTATNVACSVFSCLML